MMLGNASLIPPPADVTQAIALAYFEGLEAIKGRSAPAGLLYHYCDANALLSIFQHRQVWATDARYLNDSKELVSLFGNVARHLELASSETERYVRTQLMNVADFAPKFGVNVIGLSSYAACFSEDGDVLSQWRAYGSDGMGFAIGFEPRELGALCDGGTGSLKRMIYGGVAEEQIITDYFGKIVRALTPIEGAFARYGYPSMTFDAWLQLRMSEFLHEVAFECKHPAFHEEREWRILASGGDIRFRASNNRIAPYKSLDMSSSVTPSLMPVKQIVIGPRADKVESLKALTFLSDALGYGHSGIAIRYSSAPYR
ncbi:Protein of unknown function [Bosea sp. OK403]|nr:Protein of unknown function [Bosea sp. OK403]